MTAEFESNILTLTWGNEANPNTAVSLYVKNGISHEKVKLSGIFFSQKLSVKMAHMQLEEKRLMVNLKKKIAVVHNGLLIPFGKNSKWKQQTCDVGHQLSNIIPGTW